MTGPMLVVRETGALLLIEDGGRPGLLDQGVSPSGFADAASARRANRLVGNAPDAAVLESLFGGVELEATGSTVILAVSGVEAVVEVVRGGVLRRRSTESPISLAPGEVLRVGRPTIGLRPMIAVRGGVGAAAVLGSRSRDTLASLGPPPVAAGDLLGVGDDARGWPVVDHAVIAPVSSPAEPLLLGFRWGPRDDRLTDAGRRAILADRVVSSRGDRVGVRIDGPAVAVLAAELPSEPTIAGAIELPTDGIPFVLGRDHPVTVGYPIVGVVDARSLDRLAQARPGSPVRFVPAR